VNPSQSPPLGGGVLQTDTSGLKIVTTTQITTGNFTVNNGNVGIGTTGPSSKLEIASVTDWWGIVLGTDGNKHFLIGRGNNLAERRLTLHIPNAAQYGGGAQPQLQVVSSGDVRLLTVEADTGNTYIRGNVGIGTTGPTAKLTIGPQNANHLELQSANSAWGWKIETNDFLGGNVPLQIFQKNAGTYTEVMRITQGGNVGIGTTEPTHKLEVNSSADWLTAKFDSPGPWTAIKMRAGNTLVNTLGLFMHYGGTGAGDNNQFRLGRANPNDPNMGWFGANPVIFDLDAPDSTFVVQGDGNVGIGTYSPWSKLSIEQSGGNSGVGIHRPGVSAGGVAAGLQNTAGISLFSNWWGGFSGEPIRFGWAPWNGDWNNFTEVMRIHTNGNVGIGTTAPDYKLRVEGTVAAYSWVTLSDISLKKDIQPLNYGILDKVLKLNPVSFYWKDENMDKEKHFGFVAQEVEEVLPELVRQDSQGKKTLNYNELIPYLVRAIQEQQKEIEELKAILNSKH
jgi:hypothetical protein